MIELNKDKRSLVLLLLLGDGHLSKSYRSCSYLEITHGESQSDYAEWKRKYLSTIVGRELKLSVRKVRLNGNLHNSYRVKVGMTRFKAWRKYCYPSGKKDISRIIKHILHPELALAVWLMDDGTVHFQSNRYPQLVIHTDSESLESCEKLKLWFLETFGVSPRIHMRTQRGKKYPTLRFNSKDSITIWKLIRKFVLQLKSMQHKFRNLESFVK